VFVLCVWGLVGCFLCGGCGGCVEGVCVLGVWCGWVVCVCGVYVCVCVCGVCPNYRIKKLENICMR